ncbi:Hsp70 family protein [Amycolatopsis sp. PS_44_ISF1]|uniref:Hsp70 family protein n=1 Tax=Amycolatopsis sp. PS_44_ISF1 TaxID=2974917 RepID=UPI0028DEF924|nr:Hsp70 family protein [Amycolatopsis sp. PS_44_ISF1]MDT8911653.1 Hsp70 family protein [Amycolatopsis sp. PS_44_ISF1]
MWYAAGIDLGTSFAAAAVAGPGGADARVVPLGPDLLAASVAYQTDDTRMLTGARALAAADDPARLARNFKRRLGDPTPLVLGGSAHSAAALMAAQLRAVLGEVAGFAGGPPASVVVTCPAIWGPYRREHFTEVMRLADVADYRLITEPEAAATHYSGESRLGDGEVVAVYDLGGGTFDTTILRVRGAGTQILGTPGGIEHLGGADFDETLVAHVDRRLGGAVTGLDPARPGQASALAEIRARCVRAKEELSVEPDVRLTVPLPSGPRELTITRVEFNEMIRPSIRLTTEALRRTVASAGLRPEDLSAVLLAGGSSRIPLIAQLVAQEFDRPVRVTLHPKFTVALGAAVAAARPAAPAQPSPSRTVPRPHRPPPDPSPGWPEPGPGTRPPAPDRSSEPDRPPAPRRSPWPIPAVAAAIVVVLALGTTLFLLGRMNSESSIPGGDLETGVYDAPTPTGPVASAETLPIYGNGAVAPFTGFIGPVQPLADVRLKPDGNRSKGITATPADGGLRVHWDGTVPSRFSLRTPERAQDLSSYVDSRGVLTFDIVVNSAPRNRVLLSAFCGYPSCRSVLAAGDLFKQMPAGRRTTVKIPLACFMENGLDVKRTDAPFALYADGEFDATFDNVRWQKDAADDNGVISCAELDPHG